MGRPEALDLHELHPAHRDPGHPGSRDRLADHPGRPGGPRDRPRPLELDRHGRGRRGGSAGRTDPAALRAARSLVGLGRLRRRRRRQAPHRLHTSDDRRSPGQPQRRHRADDPAAHAPPPLHSTDADRRCDRLGALDPSGDLAGHLLRRLQEVVAGLLQAPARPGRTDLDGRLPSARRALDPLAHRADGSHRGLVPRREPRRPRAGHGKRRGGTDRGAGARGRGPPRRESRRGARGQPRPPPSSDPVSLGGLRRLRVSRPGPRPRPARSSW